MTGYETYLKIQASGREKHKNRAEYANNEPVPQHILWTKSVCDLLEDDTAKCETINGKFYFTEILVNKLMHLAYLDGCSDIDKDSFNRGWNEREKDLRKRLDLL